MELSIIYKYLFHLVSIILFSVFLGCFWMSPDQKLFPLASNLPVRMQHMSRCKWCGMRAHQPSLYRKLEGVK